MCVFYSCLFVNGKQICVVGYYSSVVSVIFQNSKVKTTHKSRVFLWTGSSDFNVYPGGGVLGLPDDGYVPPDFWRSGKKNGKKWILEGTEMEKNPNFHEFYDPYWDFFARNLGC